MHAIRTAARECLPAALATAAALLIVLATVPAARAAAPREVGVLEPLAIESPHPYPAAERGAAWERTITFPGATYIRLHFSRFDLAPGDFVELVSPRRSAPAVYAGRGPHGSGEFWAGTAPGDTVTIRLHATVGGGEGIVIDSAGRGIVPLFDTAPLRGGDLPMKPGLGHAEGADAEGRDAEFVAEEGSSAGAPPDSSLASAAGAAPEPGLPGLVCGARDWQDARCYEASRPAEFAQARGAALALVGCCFACTAFKVSDSGQFLYSYTCSQQSGNVPGTELLLDYESTECNGSLSGIAGTLEGRSALAADTNAGLDYVLFDTIGDSSAIPCLQLDPRPPALGERIYIPHHPDGGIARLSIESDLDAGGLCQVDPLGVGGPDARTDFGFMCDTGNGSLGAPVISALTGRVVGISHWGACPNAASRMDQIVPQIASLLGGCSDGVPCSLVHGGRCDCNAVCSARERRYVNHGGVCPDCAAGEPGLVAPSPRKTVSAEQ